MPNIADIPGALDDLDMPGKCPQFRADQKSDKICYVIQAFWKPQDRVIVCSLLQNRSAQNRDGVATDIGNDKLHVRLLRGSKFLTYRIYRELQ